MDRKELWISDSQRKSEFLITIVKETLIILDNTPILAITLMLREQVRSKITISIMLIKLTLELKPHTNKHKTSREPDYINNLNIEMEDTIMDIRAK